MQKKKWPLSDERELEKLKEVLSNNGWWRGSGNMVDEFEKNFSSFHNTKYALAVSNGTQALEIALRALGIEKECEVIVPAFTFIATATAVMNVGATPVFCDVNKDTFCMDADDFERKITSKTKAVIPVHMGGQLCDMEKISKIAKRNNIQIIEDAAHAHGGEWCNNKVGYYSDIATFSFQNRKVMTCGEGGALITNNPTLYKTSYLLHSVGRPPGDLKYEHLILGTNARMNEFQAAILLCQLERLTTFTKIREKNANILDNLLADVKGITPQKQNKKCTFNTHYMYMFYYDSTYFGNMKRETFISKLNAEGIECHFPYPLVFDAKFYKTTPYIQYKEADFPNSSKIAKEVVWIPHYELLEDVKYLRTIHDKIISLQNTCEGH